MKNMKLTRMYTREYDNDEYAIYNVEIKPTKKASN